MIFSAGIPFKRRTEAIYFLLLLMGTCVPFTLRLSRETLGSLEPATAGGFSLEKEKKIKKSKLPYNAGEYTFCSLLMWRCSSFSCKTDLNLPPELLPLLPA